MQKDGDILAKQSVGCCTMAYTSKREHHPAPPLKAKPADANRYLNPTGVERHQLSVVEPARRWACAEGVQGQIAD